MNRAVQLICFIVLIVVLRLWNGNAELLPPLPSSPQSPTRSGSAPTSQSPETAQVFVQRVVDGDTLLLVGGERVRLLGVDTPETKKPNTPVQPFGPEASEFTRRLVEGKMVTLVFDRERYDKYRRTLAFVYVDNLCLNEELIRAGLSLAHLQYPFRSDMKQRFRAAEEAAKLRNVGLWSLSPPPPSAVPSSSLPAPSNHVQPNHVQPTAPVLQPGSGQPAGDIRLQ